MAMHLRCDQYFVEDEAWHEAEARYEVFLAENQEKRVLFLELGVGMNTPVIIKYPFWQMTRKLDRAFYICVNRGQAWAPEEISERSLCMDGDIAEILNEVRAQ